MQDFSGPSTVASRRTCCCCCPAMHICPRRRLIKSHCSLWLLRALLDAAESSDKTWVPSEAHWKLIHQPHQQWGVQQKWDFSDFFSTSHKLSDTEYLVSYPVLRPSQLFLVSGCFSILLGKATKQSSQGSKPTMKPCKARHEDKKSNIKTPFFPRHPAILTHATESWNIFQNTFK